MAIWPLAGYNFQVHISLKRGLFWTYASYEWQMKPQAKNNFNFTFILPTFIYKTSAFPKYQNLGGGAQILLNQAQYFRFVSACWLLKYSGNMPTTQNQYFYAWFAYINIKYGNFNFVKKIMKQVSYLSSGQIQIFAVSSCRLQGHEITQIPSWSVFTTLYVYLFCRCCWALAHFNLFTNKLLANKSRNKFPSNDVVSLF